MDSLLTNNDLARLLQLSPSTVTTRRSRSPHLLPPAVKVGTTVRWRPEDVQAWLDEHAERAPR